MGTGMTRPTEDQIRKALRGVKDPELNLNIVDLLQMPAMCPRYATGANKSNFYCHYSSPLYIKIPLPAYLFSVVRNS